MAEKDRLARTVSRRIRDAIESGIEDIDDYDAQLVHRLRMVRFLWKNHSVGASLWAVAAERLNSGNVNSIESEISSLEKGMDAIKTANEPYETAVEYISTCRMYLSTQGHQFGLDSKIVDSQLDRRVWLDESDMFDEDDNKYVIDFILTAPEGYSVHKDRSAYPQGFETSLAFDPQMTWREALDQTGSEIVENLRETRRIMLGWRLMDFRARILRATLSEYLRYGYVEPLSDSENLVAPNGENPDESDRTVHAEKLSTSRPYAFWWICELVRQGHSVPAAFKEIKRDIGNVFPGAYPAFPSVTAVQSYFKRRGISINELKDEPRQYDPGAIPRAMDQN